MTHALIKYDKACRAIADAKRVDEVKAIRNEAAALRAYAKQAKNKQLEADALEIRMRAARRLDELVKQQKATVGLSRGTAGKGRPKKIGGSKTDPPKRDDRLSLGDVGIDKHLAHEARKLGALSNSEFEKAVSEARGSIDGVVKRAVKSSEIREARKDYESRKDAGGTVDDLYSLASSGKRFSVIYADPPWEFKVYSGKGKQRSAERYYDVQSLDDIKSLPVEALAAKDCALFLWAVMPELPGALAVIEAWGFEYKTAGFVWVKQTSTGDALHWGMGYWTRANAEICLLATRGNPQRLAKDVHQIIMSPVGAHSEKPEETRKRIERLLAGPYLELFARQEIEGWTVWGNEI